MALFYKRPLACACACFVAAVFFGYFASVSLCFWLAGAFLLPALALFCICLLRGFSYRKLFLLLTLVALSLGAFRTAIDRVGVQDVREAYGEQAVLSELVIEDVLYQNAYGAEFLARVHSVASEKWEQTVILRFDTAIPFVVGDRISGEFYICDLDFDAYRGDADYQYFSEGAKLLFVCEDAQTLSLAESGINTLSAKLSRLRAIAAFRLSDTVGGEEGKLLAAMLLGAKDKLSDATIRDFRLSGVSHLLALSGLHLMILVGLSDRLLCLLRASKRVRIALLLPLCLFYLLFTGCNVSLLRAMLMLGVVYLSFLLREEGDSLTALFVSAAAILAFAPFAVFSLSFQMTMLATLGILAFSKCHTLLYKILPIRKGIRDLPLKALWGILSSLLITLTTTVCLTPVLWLTVGSLSLMTPLANLALVPLAPALLFGAVLCLALPFSPVGSAVGLVARLALLLSRFFASFDLTLSLTRAYVPYILIPFLLISAILLLLDLKRRYWLALAPLAATILAFAVVLPVSEHLGGSQLQVAYRRDGNNEGLILVQNGSAVLCDVSGSSLTQWRADWYAAQKMGATRIEVLLLTHYHSKSVSALSRFSQGAYVHALWLPEPQTQTDTEILVRLLEVAQKQGLSVTLYEHGIALTVFERGTLTLHAPLRQERSAEPAFSLDVTFAGQTLCYHSAALSEYLREQERSHDCHATHLVLGAHGPVPHDTVQLPPGDALSTVLVGSERAMTLLEPREDLVYFIYPDKHTYVLK